MNKNFDLEKNKMKILFAVVGGFVLIAVIAAIFMFTMGKDEEKVDLKDKDKDIASNVVFETTDGQIGYYNDEGEFVEASKYDFKEPKNKEDLVTFKGEKNEFGFAIYSVKGYESMYWAHYNNVAEYLKLNYPADKFSILEVKPADDSILMVDVTVLSEKKGEFLIQPTLVTNLEDTFVIAFDEYRLALQEDAAYQSGIYEDMDENE